jgi:beta-lactamase superfamily II metal-dependent hydrolase
MATFQPFEAVIDIDLADVWAEPGRKQLVRTMVWGDAVTVIGRTPKRLEIQLTAYRRQADGSSLAVATTGYIEPTASSGVAVDALVRPQADNRVLKVHFVDVQQGDGALIESPDGKVILVDGGDNPLFARYLAGHFRGSSATRPQPVEAIVVTHGDADHFSGLNEILASETHATARKRLFMSPKRVFHNGIVKRPDKLPSGRARPDRQMLGATRTSGDQLYLTGLEQDLLAVPDAQMNKPFLAWKRTLATYAARAPIEFRRLALGDDAAFDFFNRPGLSLKVLGPLTKPVAGKTALRFLGEPRPGPRVGHESLATDDAPFTGYSASHTINGHSIVLRLAYGGFSFLFCGDLNDEAGRELVKRQQAGTLALRSEVMKVPHHGSADFSGAFIQAVSPLVSVVSSGDENERKEYIHPRATLMGALGRWSRGDEPLVLVTELVAFFKTEGMSRLADAAKAARRGDFWGFSRTVFGLVKTRTDGQRLLVVTDSGNLAMKEAYAYTLDAAGEPVPARVVRA